MKKFTLFALLCCTALGVYAQQIAYVSDSPLMRKNPIESKLFKLEDVMKHQKALNLSKTQKDNIIKAHQEAQMEFAKWQWDLQASTEEMSELVSSIKIDETKAMQTLERMIDLERNIKRTQLGLMIKIKNQLNKEQQEKLRELTSSRSYFFGEGGTTIRGLRNARGNDRDDKKEK